MTRVRFIGKDREGHLAGNVLECFGQKVHCPMRAFIVPNGCSAVSRRCRMAWVVVEASLCLLHDVLALPARNPPLVPGCSAGFDRISGGSLMAVVPTYGVQENQLCGSAQVCFRVEGRGSQAGVLTT